LIAFTAQDSAGKRLLWIREIDSLIAHPLAGTDGAAYPFWSPDSRFIAYAITGKLMRVPVAGGPPLMVCALNAGITSRGGSWSKSDVLVFNNGPAVLSRVSASGGNATPIGTLKSGESGRQFPFFLPDGRHFLYFATGASEQVAGLYAGSLDDETTTRIMSTTTGAIFDEKTGRLLFTRQGTLLAQPFDAATFKVSGEPTPVGERVESVVVPGVVAFSVSTTGMLVYGTGESSVTDFQLTWVDRHGRVLGTLGTPAPFRGIALSPNGLQLATHRHEADGGDIWVTDIERNATTRLTFDAQQENSSPVWSPTGSQIAFSSLRNGAFGIYVKSVNGTGAETKLFESPGIGSLVPFSWAPDNSSLVFMMPGAKTSTDLWRVSLSADHKVTPVLQSPASENHGQFSPDGRWLAYTSTETGKPEVYVKPAFADTGKWNVSGGSGNAPRWRGDSREIFYISASGKMMAVAISVKGDALVPGTPAPLFDYVGIANIGHPSLYSWAVTADGQRFLLSNLAAGASAIVQEPIVVVLNWRSAIAK
jgi:Tol biopolymer transport system component